MKAIVLYELLVLQFGLFEFTLSLLGVGYFLFELLVLHSELSKSCIEFGYYLPNPITGGGSVMLCYLYVLVLFGF